MVKPPEQLAKYQDIRRKTTLVKIQNAIDELNAEGFIVNKKTLIERTGFSAALFSKRHVKELLKTNKVCQFKESKVVPSTTGKDISVFQLQNELFSANKKIARLEKQEELVKKYAETLQTQLEEAKEECKLLRGQLFIFVEKAKIYGIDLE